MGTPSLERPEMLSIRIIRHGELSEGRVGVTLKFETALQTDASSLHYYYTQPTVGVVYLYEFSSCEFLSDNRGTKNNKENCFPLI